MKNRHFFKKSNWSLCKKNLRIHQNLKNKAVQAQIQMKLNTN